MHSAIKLPVLASALALFATLHAQPRYTVTELTDPSGQVTSVGGLNDNGDVVGAVGAGNGTACIWRGGVMTSLGRLPKGTYSAAVAVNAFGVVVGEGDTGNGRPQIWSTSPSGLVNIFPNNGGNTHVIGVNNSGAICGFYNKSLSGNTASWHGAIWTVDPKDARKFRMVDLPSIPGVDPAATNALPWAFNNAGEAAGWAVNDVIGQHGAFWRNDAAHTIVDLGTLPGDWSSIAWGVNDFGQVVGESHPPSHTRAVLWQNDGVHTAVELPALPGDTDSAAQAINNQGQVIGWSTGASRTGSSVTWISGAVYELGALLDPVTGAGWVLSGVTAINNQGQIVGTGMHNGQARGFLLTPVAP